MNLNRYPGIKPFKLEEHPIFFGRDNDIDELYNLIYLNELVILFSKSGLGKSSLLNAGLNYKVIINGNYQPINIRLNTYIIDSNINEFYLINKIKEQITIPKDINNVLHKIAKDDNSLWYFFKNLQLSSNVFNYPVLIFDQFEELFTYPEHVIFQFKKQISELLYPQIPSNISESIDKYMENKDKFFNKEELFLLFNPLKVKVLFAIRSDKLSLLNSLSEYLPNILQKCYELKPLSKEQTINAITQPALLPVNFGEILFETPQFKYPEVVISNIINYLTEENSKSIETFQIQIVCQYIESIIKDKTELVATQNIVVEPVWIADLDNLFRNHYISLISKITNPSAKLAARKMIEEQLIIEGNRVSLPEIVLIQQENINKELLSQLTKSHLLRAEPNTVGGYSYEISHDTLVKPILNAKLKRIEEEREQKIRKEYSEKYYNIQSKQKSSLIERDLELIIRGIQQEKCLVILGQEFGFTNDNFYTNIAEYLQNDNISNKFDFDNKLFSFGDVGDRIFALSDIQNFIENQQVNPSIDKLLSIPFHLYLTLNNCIIPLLKSLFEKYNCQFEYFHKQMNSKPTESFSKENPLFYGLLGNIEEESSFVITYNDILDYLFSIMGYSLPIELKASFRSIRTIILIDVDYSLWYIQLILRALSFNGNIPSFSISDRNIQRNFFSDEYKIKNINVSVSEFIDSLYIKCQENNLLRLDKKEYKTLTPEIFISYSWGGISEDVVNKIYDLFVAKEFNIIKGKIDLGYNSNIKQFMQTIGRGEFVIIIISDKYLKSEYCMYELFELSKNKNSFERVFPIILSDAKLYDEIDRIDYLNYWDDKIQQLQDKIKTISNSVGIAQIIEKVNLYQDMRRRIDEITDLLRNMNTLTSNVHGDENFEILSQAISSKYKEDLSAIK